MWGKVIPKTQYLISLLDLTHLTENSKPPMNCALSMVRFWYNVIALSEYNGPGVTEATSPTKQVKHVFSPIKEEIILQMQQVFDP